MRFQEFLLIGIYFNYFIDFVLTMIDNLHFSDDLSFFSKLGIGAFTWNFIWELSNWSLFMALISLIKLITVNLPFVSFVFRIA